LPLNYTKSVKLFNRQIFVYSEIILKALYRSDVKNGGNGARLYFLAKDWDQSKRGSILEDDFRSYIANDLKIADWNYRRWINSAIEIGLIKKTITPKGKKLMLAGYRKACDLLEINRLRPMQAITIKDLLGKNWQAELWACFLVNYQGRPIARQTLFNISGVKKSTQRNLEKRTNKIKNIRNFAKDASLDKSHLTGFRDHVRNNAFINNNQITFRIADTKEVKGIQAKSKTSTLKHINAFIRSSCILAGKIKYSRLYCENDKELKIAEQNRDPYKNYLFLKAEGKQRGFNLYHAISYAH